jgi:hypothetical protein
MRIQWSKLKDNPESFVQDISSTGGDWVPWEPVIIGSVTSPSGYDAVGHYTVTHGYCIAVAQIVMSAGWSAGSGSYSVNAPVAPGALEDILFNYAGTGYLYDSGTDDVYSAHLHADSTNRVIALVATGTQSSVTGTYPFTWGVNDRIHFMAQYAIL